MIRRLLTALCLLQLSIYTYADELPSGQFNVAKPVIDGIPGATCLNIVTITNQTDTPWVLQLKATIPNKLHLLSQMPAVVTIPGHGSIVLPVKLLVDRQWVADEATVEVDAYEAGGSLPAISARFTVQQSRTGGGVLSFSFLNDRPYLSPGQDTLTLRLQLINDNYRARTLRLALRSVPAGFVLPDFYSYLSLTGRRDTVVTLPCLARAGLQWSRTYELLLDVFDNADGALLGSAICRPVLLSAVKHQVNETERGPGPNGILLGFTRLGQSGYFREVQGWGEQAVGNGQVSFRFDALSYATGKGQYNDLRNTYIQYKSAVSLLRVGSIYDNHELPLMGVGVKASLLRGNTQLEGWAVAGRNSLVHKQAQSFYSSVYSLRLTNPLPVGLGGTYSLSASRYEQAEFGRVGWLSFGTAGWQPSLKSRVRLLAATSLEYAAHGTDRQQATGWALGGDYNRTGERLAFTVSTYFSNPAYGGYQRGLSRIDNFMNYRLSDRTSLGYHLSLLQYNQQYIGPDGTFQRFFGNNVADITLSHQFGRLGLTLRPYYWQQTQTLSRTVRLRSETYRLLTALHYDFGHTTRLDVGFDAGQYRGLAPANALYTVDSYRLLTTLNYKSISLYGLYQQGPCMINDWLPGSGDPRDVRQIMVSPAWGFSLLDGRLQGGFGAGVSYSTQNRTWNGALRHSAGLSVNDNMQVRWNVNLFSSAVQVADLRAVPLENGLLTLEVVRQFHRLVPGSRRQLRLRFYEDANANKQHDPGETWLDGLVVNVQNPDHTEVPLLTDSRGSLTYKSLQPGAYLLKTVCKLATGEPVVFSDTIRLEGSVERDVPIRKTWPVKGVLVYTRTRFDDSPAELDGYRIEARADDGELIRTYADEAGRFTLFLPVGEYQVSVLNSRQYAPKPVLTTAYRVAAGVVPGVLKLAFETGGRPAQIKRFGSR